MDVSCTHEDGKQTDTISELRTRLTLLEHELQLTNARLSSTEVAFASLETRFAASEASTVELRQQVVSLYSALEELRNAKDTRKADDRLFGNYSEHPTSELPTIDKSSAQVTGDTILSLLDVADGKSCSVMEGITVVSEANTYCVNDLKSQDSVQVEWTSGAVQNGEQTQVESIADCVRAAAESAVVESNFVFDSRTGLYYDYVTGYYYDAEKSLYYEPQSGLYFYFDETLHEYKYHSRVESTKHRLLTHIIYGSSSEKKGKSGKKLKGSKRLQRNTDSTELQRLKLKENKLLDSVEERKDVALVYLNRKERRVKVCGGLSLHEVNKSSDEKNISSRAQEHINESRKNTGPADRSNSKSSSGGSVDELEEGELETSVSECSDDAFTVDEVVSAEEMHNCTPCIRAMVMQSNSLIVGSLFVITCTGGTIGRDTDLGHSIVIPDPLISKMHCSISYSEDRQRYVVMDHASQAGTFVNNRRLAKAKTISEPHVVYHGDSLRLAGTTFDLHIHPRAETCSACEPGCFEPPSEKPEIVQDVLTSGDKERERRRQLKKLKNKFGLTAMNYEDHSSVRVGGGGGLYQDRAAERRQTVGSDLPVDTNYVEPASVHRPISEQNVGHKMLSKMGWKDGEGLGKNRNDAIIEPINVEVRLKQTAGLGAYAGSQRSLDDVTSVASGARWIKAQDRYAKLSAGVCKDTSAADPSELSNVASTSVMTRTTIGPIKWVKTDAST